MRATEQRRYHDHVDPHVRGRWLTDLVLGMQDGLVNTLGVVLGVAAAGASAKVVLAAGLAGGVAEAVSMGAVGYTTSVARGELFRAERAREYRHVAITPDIEREEVRVLYANKGFSGALLERVVETICADRDVWVAVMMAEEHALTDVDRRACLRSAAFIGAASLVGAVVPVLPFAFGSRAHASVWSLVTSTVGLFALGAYKSRVTTTGASRGGAALAAIGVASALAGYVVGALFATGAPG